MQTMPGRRVSRREQMSLFARNFLRHPRMLGSLVPSSRFLVQKVLRRVDWDRARVVVEYGPGVGNFTAEILARLAPDSTLVVIEMNEDFVRYLRRTLPDKRLRVVHGSAADVASILEREGLGSADYVVSGIPFSTMPDEVRVDILRATHSVLKPDGAFLVYQFSGGVLPDLKRIFGWVHQGFEPLNVLPARLFYCMP
ncbi:MAG TPA: methyltransferase domain-containing protein [Longimicrobiaceae bacterium]|nr:methyltransferase domain-containing protein [Longimicrobiaceae bacterium]